MKLAINQKQRDIYRKTWAYQSRRAGKAYRAFFRAAGIYRLLDYLEEKLRRDR